MLGGWRELHTRLHRASVAVFVLVGYSGSGGQDGDGPGGLFETAQCGRGVGADRDAGAPNANNPAACYVCTYCVLWDVGWICSELLWMRDGQIGRREFGIIIINPIHLILSPHESTAGQTAGVQKPPDRPSPVHIKDWSRRMTPTNPFAMLTVGSEGACGLPLCCFAALARTTRVVGIRKYKNRCGSLWGACIFTVFTSPLIASLRPG